MCLPVTLCVFQNLVFRYLYTIICMIESDGCPLLFDAHHRFSLELWLSVCFAGSASLLLFPVSCSLGISACHLTGIIQPTCHTFDKISGNLSLVNDAIPAIIRQGAFSQCLQSKYNICTGEAIDAGRMW